MSACLLCSDTLIIDCECHTSDVFSDWLLHCFRLHSAFAQLAKAETAEMLQHHANVDSLSETQGAYSKASVCTAKITFMPAAALAALVTTWATSCPRSTEQTFNRSAFGCGFTLKISATTMPLPCTAGGSHTQDCSCLIKSHGYIDQQPIL